jgi:hypothetical protein
MTSAPRPRLMQPTPPASMPQHQLSMAFESPALQGMDPTQRAHAITQLAILLMQAAGVQLPGAHDDER